MLPIEQLTQQIRKGHSITASIVGLVKSLLPIILSIAGRANSSKVIMELTGLPGNPR